MRKPRRPKAVPKVSNLNRRFLGWCRSSRATSLDGG